MLTGASDRLNCALHSIKFKTARSIWSSLKFVWLLNGLGIWRPLFVSLMCLWEMIGAFLESAKKTKTIKSLMLALLSVISRRLFDLGHDLSYFAWWYPSLLYPFRLPYLNFKVAAASERVNGEKMPLSRSTVPIELKQCVSVMYDTPRSCARITVLKKKSK